MATITSSIGTSARTYSTIAAWEAALPANFVTATNSYVGECYNDSEFTGTSFVVNFAAHVTDATHTCTLTAAAGQSFQDNASVRSNALQYNVSNGVGLKITAAYGNSVVTSAGTVDYLFVNRLQLKVNATNADANAYAFSVNDHVNVKDVIADSNNTTNRIVAAMSFTSTNNQMMENVLVIMRSSATGQPCVSSTANMIACNIIRPSNFTAGGTGINVSPYRSAIVTSCNIFGFTTPIQLATGGGASTVIAKNNATDQATFGTGVTSTSSQTSVTFNSTTPFVSGSNTSSDYRAIASTALAANGFKDTTNAPNDISGTVRSATPTIGVWELTGGAVVRTDLFFFGS